MRLSRRPESYYYAAFILPSLAAASSGVDCSQVLVNEVKYDISALSGPHTVGWLEEQPGSTSLNHTFTLDICKPLQRDDSEDKDWMKECHQGANICQVEYTHHGEDNTYVSKVVSIAGQFTGSHGRSQNAKWSRLKESDSHEDSDKDGLRLEMNGGRFRMNDRNGIDQRAYIEFTCDKMEGDEGLGELDSHFKAPKRRRSPDDGEDNGDENEGDGGEDDDEDDPEEDDGKALTFKSYKLETHDGNSMEVLRLNWKTKWACENAKDDKPKKTEGSWGFFTWFLIVLFLGIAAYLVFGSWLNYNRYGARGWDLLPHGDTIRDLPYLLKDWARRVMGSFQGSSNRGGYSAV